MNCFGFSKDWILNSISNEQIYFNTKSSLFLLVVSQRNIMCWRWFSTLSIILQRIGGIKNWPPNVELLIQILVPKNDDCVWRCRVNCRGCYLIYACNKRRQRKDRDLLPLAWQLHTIRGGDNDLSSLLSWSWYGYWDFGLFIYLLFQNNNYFGKIPVMLHITN